MTTYINASIILKLLPNLLFGLSMLVGIPSGSVMSSVAVDEQYQTVQVAAGKSVSKQGRRTDFLMDKGFIFRRAKKAERAGQERTTVCLTRTRFVSPTLPTTPSEPTSLLMGHISRI